MNLARPFTYFVAAPGGVRNTFFCVACNLIPVAGQVALLGYRAGLAEELVRGGPPPTFDFGRFGDYLRRGLGPAVYQLAFAVLVGGLVFGGALLARAGLERAADTRDPYFWLAVVFLTWAAAALGLTILAAGLLWPMELHAQLSRRFAPVEAARFAARFQRRVWGQSLLALLAFLPLCGLLNLLGLLCLVVGLYGTVVIQFMAQQHVLTQLYHLFLADGGEPIRGPDDAAGYDD